MIKILLGFMLLSSVCFGQQLDSTFHYNGNHKLNLLNFANNNQNQHTKIALQSNQKIILGGVIHDTNSIPAYNIILTRLTKDGFIDSTFGSNGISTLTLDTAYQNYIRSSVVIGIQSDDKIIIAAHLQKLNLNNERIWIWARLTKDGQLDSSFANNGITYYSYPFGNHQYFINAVVLPNDDIYLFNWFNSGKITKLKANGIIDSSFGVNGFASYPSFNQPFIISKGIVQADGKILFTGSTTSKPINFYLGRLLNNGLVDSSFGINGSTITNIDSSDNSYSLVEQADGKILVAGMSADTSTIVFSLGDSTKAVLLRYTTEGVLDTTFNHMGFNYLDNPVYIYLNEFTDVHIHNQDRILVTGHYQTNANQLGYLLANYKFDGTLDSTFGNQGVLKTIENDSINFCNYSVFQGANKILLHGESRNSMNYTGYKPMVARYILDLSLGLLEKGNQLPDMLIYPNPIQQQTQLRYALTETKDISIRLLDMQGRVVKTFLSKQKQHAGNYQMNLIFDSGLAEGNYILQITSTQFKKQIQLTKKAN